MNPETKPKVMTTINVKLGADPEFFFEKDGKVIGAELILPKGGVKVVDNWNENPIGKVIIDGVQAEINVLPFHCRQSLGNQFIAAFAALEEYLKSKPGVSVINPTLIKVSKEHMKTLSDRSQQFGCAPSLNIHGEQPIGVDPTEYLYRGAGGHLHFGHAGVLTTKNLFENPEKAVALMDIIVGNTCVLLDRQRGNAERRKVYGRAGEYRLPKHGLEYRTLSNFWLRDYKLMSFVFNLSRQALAYGLEANTEFYNELIAVVNMKDVVKAINTNNKRLAQKNFNAIKKILVKNARPDYSAIHKNNLQNFEYLVEEGIDYFFKDDMVKSWTTCNTNYGSGWESWSVNALATSRRANQKTVTKSIGIIAAKMVGTIKKEKVSV